MENITKTERIDIRLSGEEKVLLEKAAAATNRTLSSYILSNIIKLAKEDLAKFGIEVFDNEEMATFIDLLANPPKPNKALIELFKW